MIVLFLIAIILLVFAGVAFKKKKDKKIMYSCLVGGIICLGISLEMQSSTTVQKSGNDNVIEKDSSTSANMENSIDKKSDKIENSSYKLGDTIDITTKKGSYRLRIDGISETNDRNQFSDKRADRVVLIDYSYENIDMEEDLYIFDSHFKAYDKDSNSLETYPVLGKFAEKVSAGRKTSGQMTFALNNNSNYIELEYYNNMFQSKKDCVIIIEW